MGDVSEDDGFLDVAIITIWCIPKLLDRLKCEFKVKIAKG
jgi:hypothetical protein